MRKAKKIGIGIIIVIAGFFAQSFELSFAQSSEESLGSSAMGVASHILTALIVLIIPILIVLYSLKRKGTITNSLFKKSLGGIGLLFLGLMVLGIAGATFQSDEEIAEQERLEEQKQKQIELQKQFAEQDQKYSNAKKELNNYLQSVEKATSECNRLPNSVKISSLVEKEADEIVVNSVLMILLIDEAPIDSGLLPYKQKIITAVDELTKCLNRH